MTPWSERLIGRELALNYFQRRNLVVVPNCSWPGSECDLLVVTANLRIIDVEIKISRPDLRADAKKDKWYHSWDFEIDGPWVGWDAPRRPRQWPQKVWKHYYAIPREIWTDELAASISPVSGVLLLYRGQRQEVLLDVWRPSKPCRDAEKISAENAVDIARLASLRMWDAYSKTEVVK